MFAMNPRCLALVALLAAAGASSRADANLFGLFRARQRPCETPAVATYRPTSVYAAPTGCSSCVARPVAVAAGCGTCSAPAAVQVPETCMENRCTQVPVTRYVTQTQNLAVTEMQRSFTYQPVTTMRVSAYYDPCTCSYYNQSVPETSMVRKEVCTPVTHYVQQHYQVPVTEYVQQCTQVPVTRMRTYVPAPTAVAVLPVAPAAPQAIPAPAPQAAPGQMALPPAGYVAAPPPAGYVAAPQQSQPAPQQPQPQPQPQAAPPAGNASGYVPPATQDPRQPKVIERIFQNGQLDRERLIMDPAAANATLAPVPAEGANAAPKAAPQAYHAPADASRVPAHGLRTTSDWRISNDLQTVSLSKPVVGR